jgi:hypothetical protein
MRGAVFFLPQQVKEASKKNKKMVEYYYTIWYNKGFDICIKEKKERR